MIVPDLNLILYAHNSAEPAHDAARRWWEALLDGPERIGMAWVVALGFVRLTTSRGLLASPLPLAEAMAIVRGWLTTPRVEVVTPGPRHLDLLESLMASSGATGRATTDAHLAALAIELRAELHSNDSGFARYPGLRWRNPLKA